MSEYTTVAEVESIAAKMGITFSPEDHTEAYTLANQRRRQVENEAISAAGHSSS